MRLKATFESYVQLQLFASAVYKAYFMFFLCTLHIRFFTNGTCPTRIFQSALFQGRPATASLAASRETAPIS